MDSAGYQDWKLDTVASASITIVAARSRGELRLVAGAEIDETRPVSIRNHRTPASPKNTTSDIGMKPMPMVLKAIEREAGDRDHHRE